MYEHKNEPLISSAHFMQRIRNNFLLSVLLILGSLLIGVWGFHVLCNLSWDDALLNASMLLSGMGPVDKPPTTSGKVFASFYALYSGLLLVLATGLIISPFVHRIMHKFHCDLDQP